MIQNRIAALIVRIIGFIMPLWGLLIQMGLFSGEFNTDALMYYTIQSNILAFALFAVLLVKTIKDIKETGTRGDVGYCPRFEMVCIIDLLLTMLVYWVLLAPTAFDMGDSSSLLSFDNLSVHLFAPLLCIVDYILFTKSKSLKYRDVYYILIFPLLYVLFTSIAGFMGYTYGVDGAGVPVRFPYFFFDYDRVGGAAFIYIGALVVIFLIISHFIYLLDRKWNKPIFLKA